MVTAAQRALEGWKRGGLFKGTGIPAPSGRYAVGCVDLMHQVSLYPALHALSSVQLFIISVSSLVVHAIINSLAISCRHVFVGICAAIYEAEFQYRSFVGV